MTTTNPALYVIGANEIINSNDFDLTGGVTFLRIQNLTATPVEWLIHKLLLFLNLFC